MKLHRRFRLSLWRTHLNPYSSPVHVLFQRPSSDSARRSSRNRLAEANQLTHKGGDLRRSSRRLKQIGADLDKNIWDIHRSG